MIARDAAPIDHRPPYKRVDLAARRKPPEPADESAPTSQYPGWVWMHGKGWEKAEG